jgi:hypothetical protein
MADVRGLVGVDRSVLNQRVYSRRHLRACIGRGDPSDSGRAIKTRIDISGPGNLKGHKPRQRAQCRNNLSRDDLGSLAQFACQLKGYRRGELTEFQVRRNLHGDSCEFEVVLEFEGRAQMLAEPILEFKIQGKCLGNA